MKRIIALLGLILILLTGCQTKEASANIAATTLPVYQFTSILCEGTGLTVTRLVTESVSCLHDYSLSVRQVKAVEAAELVILSGAGLEDFMEDLLCGKEAVDASNGIDLLESCHHSDHEGEHQHKEDSHIWLSPANAMVMVKNICAGLSAKYPQHKITFENNLQILLGQLNALLLFGQQQLGDLASRELVTFHDGFAYFADCFDLTILKAIEEESGSEASAAELKEVISIVRTHSLPAIFVETNGADAAAKVICAETGAKCFTLDMAMAGDDYFTVMYQNIDIIKEALG